MREDLGYAFFIYRTGDDALVGGVTVSNVRRGVAQCASLGYWLGVSFVGRGYMTNAVQTLATFCFTELDLHRLEAACLPVNSASIRVLERSGFRREGLARRYLKINGVWQDHFLYARLIDDDVGDHHLGIRDEGGYRAR
jgi:ribosomal-protein-alanine N-acetyltransferase